MLAIPINANAVIAMNTTSNGINSESSHTNQADRPTPANSMTRAGVKQQIAVKTVPAMPNWRRCLFVMLPRLVYAPLLLAAVLVGCSATSSNYTPDGSGTFTVHCNQSSLRWNECYDRAARLCGENGYQIVGEDDSAMPVTTTNIYEVPIIGGSMTIRCNQR